MERDRTRARRGSYRYQLRPQELAETETVTAIKPIQITGTRTCGAKKFLVFADQDEIVLSIMLAGGTVNVPMARTVAAKLVSGLTRELAQPVAPEDEPVRRRRRLGG